jgi:hypothetical protein
MMIAPTHWREMAAIKSFRSAMCEPPGTYDTNQGLDRTAHPALLEEEKDPCASI